MIRSPWQGGPHLPGAQGLQSHRWRLPGFLGGVARLPQNRGGSSHSSDCHGLGVVPGRPSANRSNAAPGSVVWRGVVPPPWPPQLDAGSPSPGAVGVPAWTGARYGMLLVFSARPQDLRVELIHSSANNTVPCLRRAGLLGYPEVYSIVFAAKPSPPPPTGRRPVLFCVVLGVGLGFAGGGF